MRVNRRIAIAATTTSLLALAVVAAAVAQNPDPGRQDGGQTAKAKTRVVEAPPVDVAVPPPDGDRPAPEPRRRYVGNDHRTHAILMQLDEMLTMSFPQETPLEDVLKYIRSNTQSKELGLPDGIPFYFDPTVDSEASRTATLQSPVTIDLTGVPIRRTLFLILRQMEMTYYVVDGVVIITSEEHGDPHLVAPMPTGPSPLLLMQRRAERGEMTAAERKEFIQTLRDLKEIDALLSDPEYGKPAAPKPTGVFR